MGALITIEEVQLLPLASPFRGCNVESPTVGAVVEAGGMQIAGWILGEEAAVDSVEIVVGGRVVRRSPLGVLTRPDLVKAYPDLPWALSGGFLTHVELLGPSPLVDVEIRGVASTGRAFPVGLIRGRRCWGVDEVIDDSTLVSIVIPCYNQAHYLPEAIESALAQTHRQIEVVVIDDGSSDNTSRVAARYPAVRCVSQSNAGLAAARNEGIRQSVGDFIVFLDSDDRLLPEAVEVALNEFRARPDAAFVFGQYRLLSALGALGGIYSGPPLDGDPYLALLAGSSPGTPATGMYRRAIFEHLKGFDTTCDAVADYELALRAARDFGVVSHAVQVVEYRQHATSMSRDNAKMMRQVMAVHRRHRPRGPRQTELARQWRRGRHEWRRHFSARVVDQIEGALAGSQIGVAWRAGVVLARYDWAALVVEMRRASRRRRGR
jgi:glycosyltransferase involved in cell wall biosynthesis